MCLTGKVMKENFSKVPDCIEHAVSDVQLVPVTQGEMHNSCCGLIFPPASLTVGFSKVLFLQYIYYCEHQNDLLYSIKSKKKKKHLRIFQIIINIRYQR